MDFGNQPVDYSSLIGQGQNLAGNPIAQQQAGVNLQNSQIAGQQVQQQMAMQRYALQRQQSFGQDLGSYIKNPSASGLATLFGKYPEYEQQATAARGALDRGDITELGSAAALAAKGQYGEAAKVIQSRIDAETAAGTDPAKIAQSKHVLDLLNSGDPQQQKGALGLLSLGVGIAVGPEKAAEFLKANGLSSEPIDVAMDHRLVTASGQPIVGASPKLESVTNPVTGESTGFNPYTGTYGAAATDGSGTAAPTSTGGGGQASGGVAAAPEGAPRSVRNNNPGNLRATPFTKTLPGYQGADDAGYAVFANPESGSNAQTQLLSGKAYYGGGRQTVASIVSKWAPSKTVGGDNTPAQTANYIKYVAQRLGVSPAQKLTPAQLPQLAQAMSQFEAGASGHAGPVRVPPAVAPNVQGGAAAQGAPVSDPYHFGTAGLNTKGAEPGHAWNPDHTAQIPVPGTDADPNAYSPQDIDTAARMWLPTGQFPTGGGGMGGGGQMTLGYKNAVIKRAMQIWQQNGHTSDQLQDMRRQYTSLSGSLTQAQQNLSGLQAAEEGLQADANRVMEAHRALADKAPNNPNGLGIVHDSGGLGGLVSTHFANNTRLDWYERHGDPATQAAIKNYKDAVNGFAATYSKFMSAGNGTGGSAAPSDASKASADELNDLGMGPTALRAHFQSVLAEAANKRQGYQRQVDRLNNKISGLTGTGNEQPDALPSGAKVVGTYKGKRVIEVNGQRMVEQ